MDELRFRKVELSDKEWVDRCFVAMQPRISEYTFTNLYSWGSFRELEWAKRGETVFFRVNYHGERYFLSPAGYGDCGDVFRFMADYSASHGMTGVKLVTEYQKKYAQATGLPVNADRGNWDYVYRTDTFADLKGARLDGKRGFVKKFREKHKSEWFRYDNTYKADCIHLLERWMEGKREGNTGVEEEYQALRLFLDEFEHLGCVGGLLYADGKLAGFTFGEMLNSRTFVVHFEKADTAFNGVYQTLGSQFAAREAKGRFDFINREQDLDIEGIRKAKMSWAPLKLIKKYSLEISSPT